jgi:hypothetical protein
MWCGKWNSSAKKKSTVARFVKPTIAQIKEYAAELRFDLDPDEFFNHYEANGWKRGKTTIKDWKACVRTWKKTDSNATDPKNCNDCGAAYQSHWKFYSQVGKKKLFRCDDCREIAQVK